MQIFVKYVLLGLVLSTLSVCTPPSAKTMYMPLPYRIGFSSYHFDLEKATITFHAESKINLPVGISGLISVFTYRYSDSVYFDLKVNSAEIKENSLTVALKNVSIVNKAKLKNIPSIAKDLKNKRDSIEIIYVDIYLPDTKFYTYYDKNYYERPFISDVLKRDSFRKNGSDTLFICNLTSPAATWDSIAGIVDPDCKKFCK